MPAVLGFSDASAGQKGPSVGCSSSIAKLVPLREGEQRDPLGNRIFTYGAVFSCIPWQNPIEKGWKIFLIGMKIVVDGENQL
jgi:hypothetical protein